MSPRGPFLGSLCLATALVMACDRGGGSDAGDPAPTPQPPKPARQALTLEDYAALCTGAEPFDAAPAPAKEGDQPNRVVVFTRWAADDPYRLRQIDAFSPWHPERPNDVSLVVCL